MICTGTCRYLLRSMWFPLVSTLEYTKAEFARLVEENASAPPGERLTEADMLIDPGYDQMLERQGKDLCEEVGGIRGDNRSLRIHLY